MDDHNPTGLPQLLDEIVNGAVTRTYAYGLQRISENQQISGTWAPSFYGYDGHGNVRLLTNAAAATDTYQYDAFGMLIASTGTTPNNFSYSGEWLDGSAGLYYLRARFYDPATGRFWARDPIEGKPCCGLSWNPYIYVKDNPGNAVDPTGRETSFEYLSVLAKGSLEDLFLARKVGAFARCAYGVQGLLLKEFVFGGLQNDFGTWYSLGGFFWGCGAALGVLP